MASQTSTALFPDQAEAIASVRAQLAIGAGQLINLAAVSDSMIWDKLVAAEADAERQLNTWFSTVEVVPDDAAQSEFDAFETAGQRWATISNFDYEPEMFRGDRWGYMRLPFKPIQQIHSIIISFPAPFLMNYTVPSQWIRLDKHYGDVRLVPTTVAPVTPVGAFALVAMGGAMSYPQAIQVRYSCGLTNANGQVASHFAQYWDDLVNVVMRIAIMKLLNMAFLPTSGSISADGLSQSQSYDQKVWQAGINETLFGPDGANGGLYRAIHGISGTVLG
ncbi:hypothetical protein [Burkholderia anthina]|uniref:hypothetical protein n=1 Tax=Burkholderia anthina TaxID=179879 RepID=UPI00158D1AE1|nr:hypothetical protein [Burkholderia anthina]